MPARGGSERIPRKNLFPIAGAPLLAHTLRQARIASTIDRIVVSTDDSEIEQLALEHGAEVVRRPDELSNSTATSESALIHALDSRRARGEPDPEVVVFLQCTSPVRARDDIDTAVRLREELAVDCVFSVCHDRALYWRIVDGVPEPANYDPDNRQREQEMPRQVRENGSIYVIGADALRRTGNRLGGTRAVYEMDVLRSLQVDLPEEVPIVEWALTTITRSEIPWPDRIDLVAFDFDGVMTDNTAVVAQDGGESVRIHRGDGWGVARLRDAGVPMLIVSTEAHPVVAARADKLRLPYLQGLADKRAALMAELERRKIAPRHVVYLGNDVNDLGCFELVGLPVAVADAHPSVLASVQHVLAKPGGKGAVRELCELILARR